jgi:hypothetical protein
MMQVYQQSFSDAFAALLDLSSGQTHPMVYLYCLEEAMNVNGQLIDVPMPAQHVKMDSSVPWDTFSVYAFTKASSITSDVQCLHLSAPQDQKLHGCSSLETGLRSDESAFSRIKTDIEAQQQPSVAALSLQDDFISFSINQLKSPDFDPFSLLDDDEGQHNRFEGELLALQRMLQVPDSDNCC